MELQYIDNECYLDQGVWRLLRSDSFDYNDGDRIEQYILSAITKSKDISSNSIELESFIKDWPSRYHLSVERSFSYRSLLIGPKTKVLEIGSGCGAITRYFGDLGAEVLAIEGSLRRARITRERARDLQNVSVVSAPFDLLKFIESFDLVVCNGVLEYAPLFVKSENPFEDFLGKCNCVLSPSGVLAVAIENQYGLRYFSSGKEEHTNVLYDGLHGYPSKGASARTFSRGVLRDLLRKTIGDPEFLLPIPDYKLPRALVREDLSGYVNFGELVADLQSYDFGSVIKPRLHERLVYYELGKSNLIAEMSNSFFAIAGPGVRSMYPDGWLGSIFKDPRRVGERKIADIYVCGGSIVRVKTRIDSVLKLNGVSRSYESEGANEPWVEGVSVHTLVSQAFCRKKSAKLSRQIVEPLHAWWTSLKVGGGCIAQNKIDAIWRNAKIRKGEVQLFDQEWITEDPVSVNWMIYRSVAQFYSSEFAYFRVWKWVYRWYPPLFLMIVVGRTVGHRFKVSELWDSISREALFQRGVSGRDLNRGKMLVSVFCPLYVKEVSRVLGSSRDRLLGGALAIVVRLRRRIWGMGE